MKIVLDTNIIISAILFRGNPEKVFDLCLEGNNIKGCICPELLAELLSKLKYKFEVQDNEIEIIKDMIISRFEYMLVFNKEDICRDEKDNIILDLAGCCSADYLITGDRDLLVLKKIKSTRIITPAGFLSKIK
ncbi:MAG: putative toxin-antitoxin system toxin component, PIN family [Actinobacteria bacterium]|nr:putative toxin-antitoxin system toxin component, PIN family [Actinomycetota bacterium]